MKFKRFIFIGLILGAGLFVCSITAQQPSQSLLARLHPPSAGQVKKWAGFPETAHLTLLDKFPDDFARDYNNGDNETGKFKWCWIYEDRKGSNYARVVIAVFEPGGFWPAKRASLIEDSERNHKWFSEQKNPGSDFQAFARAMKPVTMTSGQKTYGFLLGIVPARFALHPEFDLIASEYTAPIVYDKHHPPEDLVEMGTNSLAELFTNLDLFLTSQ